MGTCLAFVWSEWCGGTGLQAWGGAVAPPPSFHPIHRLPPLLCLLWLAHLGAARPLPSKMLFSFPPPSLPSHCSQASAQVSTATATASSHAHPDWGVAWTPPPEWAPAGGGGNPGGAHAMQGMLWLPLLQPEPALEEVSTLHPSPSNNGMRW